MANLVLTPEWVEGIYQLETSDPVMGGPDGVDNRQAIQLGKRTEFLKKEVEKRAPTNNPAFTGTPTAPTPEQSTNNQQIATTEFVKMAIAALVGSAPAALDTLAELAAALGNDSNLKQVLLTEIGKKATQADFTTLKNLLVGIPFPYPLSAVPLGCLAFNGQTFSKITYPELAKKYPSGRLPDLRGEFIRGWDNGRGIDSGRGLLSVQGDAIRNITGKFKITDVYANDFLTGAYFDTSGQSSSISEKRHINSNEFLAEYPHAESIGFDASRVVPTANENRPRNIAFQYICLAA
ncbi:tail fiber protein [Mannheimia indoligenes]|uniref:tail fiber protein n=1 Tax=Mannheimia indoligenes TaxID=3103145 RepID=UPI002FE51176